MHLLISQNVPRPSFPTLKYLPSAVVDPGEGNGGRGDGLNESILLVVDIIVVCPLSSMCDQATTKKRRAFCKKLLAVGGVIIPVEYL
jgi:hypothetical protein